MIEEQQMAGLLAADVRAAPLHLLVHVAVADLRLDDPDAGRGERFVEPEVRHHGRHHHVAREPLRAREVTRGDRERVVAVADLPGVVDRDEPIAVAVEREADRGAAGAHLVLELLGVERAEAGVDVDAVRPCADRQHPGAEPAEHARRHAVGRAVGAVERDRDRAEIEGEAAAEELDVLGLGAVVVHERPDLRAPGAWCPIRRGEPLLDLDLPRVRELGAFGREELDAVVLERVVRGAEHDAAMSLQAACQKGDARRREHPDRKAIGAGR